MLSLTAVTGTFVVAIPFSAMPVLFQEISEDLGLSLVQIGSVWGVASLAGVFVSLLAGMLGDRFGIKWVMTAACLLAGILGALRGFADSFVTLMIIMFAYGIVRALLPINMTRTIGLWFRGQNLGMANGVLGLGMGLGLMLGPMISATFLSPALGGWRNVFLLYGAIGVFIGFIWFFLGKEPQEAETAEGGASESVPFRQVFSRIIRLKSVWLLAITMMFRVGSIIGMTGYLSLYLREQGWAAASADNALALFFGVSTLFVIPLASLSDRLGSRKAILFPALLMQTINLALLPLIGGNAVWVLIILAGIFMDSFFSVTLTMLLETEGVGTMYSGIALGMVFTLAQLGGVISPPLGNSFAGINSGLPFTVWAVFSALAIVTLFFVKETGRRKGRPVSSADAESLVNNY